MDFSDLTIRLLLLFFPGILCYLIVEAITVHGKRETYEVLFFTFIYGLGSYLIHAIVLFVFGFRGIYQQEGTADLLIARAWSGPTFFRSLTNAQVSIDFVEIVLAAVWAILLALVVAYCHSHKYLHNFAKRYDISRKFGDPNVWSHIMNAPETDWCVVRDIKNNLMFQGRVEKFSDVEPVAELILKDVIVYNEKTREFCYNADRMYFARKPDDITVEFQYPGTGDPNVATTTNCATDGRTGQEGGNQPVATVDHPTADTGGELSKNWQSKLWRQWKEFREQWRKFRKVAKKK